MSEPKTIGTPPWTADDMRRSLQDFAALYKHRPIKDNKGGMRAPHAFLTWFAMRSLKPKVIIESGIWHGQGTWLLEQACPEAELHCIDPRPDFRQYTSRRAAYYTQDFSTIDWTQLPRDDTVVFFDDHQDYYQRVVTSRWFGFTHLLFEDNYPTGRGNCYSLKSAFAHAGYQRTPRERRHERLRSLLGKTPQSPERAANDADAKYLEQNLDCYCEMPPVFKLQNTRWGDPWEGERYATPEPLLTSVSEPYQRVYLDEARYYTWMCYARLKKT